MMVEVPGEIVVRKQTKKNQKKKGGLGPRGVRVGVKVSRGVRGG